MWILLLHVVFSAAFSTTVKRGVNLRLDMANVGVLNYILAMPLALVWFLGEEQLQVRWTSVGLGALSGICYFVAYFMFLYAVRHQGVAATRAVAQLGITIPLLFAVFWWNEYPDAIQTIGILVAIVSLILLDARKDLLQQMRVALRWCLTLFIFLVGTAQLLAKIFTEMKVSQQTSVYIGVLFISAGIPAVTCLIWQRKMPQLTEWVWGAALGSFNLLQATFLVLALRRLPGIVVFPAGACGSLALTTLVAVLLLGERPTKKLYVGLVASSVAVILLNLTIPARS